MIKYCNEAIVRLFYKSIKLIILHEIKRREKLNTDI